jgi:hypothetical protein
MLPGLRTLLLLTIAALLAVPAVRARADLTLVQDGRARAAIYVTPAVMSSEDKNPQTLKNPAREAEVQRQRLRESVKDLALYLRKMSGADVEVIAGEPAAGDARVPILVGEVAGRSLGPVGVTYRFNQGFRIVASLKGVGLFGESDLATSYAIYTLLDRLGCRWFMPSELGECVPSLKTITLKDQDLKMAPGTWYRYGALYADDAYRRRNRMGGLPLYTGQLLELDGGPGSGYLTKEEKANHPEWMGETAEGKPLPKRFKWSNKELVEFLAQRINQKLDEDPVTSMSLVPDDGIDFDQSPQDRALDAGDFEPTLETESLTDRYLVFANGVTQRVAAKHPDVLMGMLAYVQFTRAPVREKVHPNLIPQIAAITYSHEHPVSDDAVPQNKELRDLSAKWGKLATATSYYPYAYHLAELSAPYPLIARLGYDVPFMLANNCKFYQPETMPNFETSMHGLYLGNKLAFEPSLKPQDIVRDINEKFYGHAAGEMAAYWTLMDDAWVKTPEYSGSHWGYLRRFPPATMQKAREQMDAAIAAARTDTEKARVAIADESLKQFERFMKLRHDLAEGYWAGMAAESEVWRKQTMALAERYKDQFCFTKVNWNPKTAIVTYYDTQTKETYDQASAIANGARLLTPAPLREWKYRFEKDPKVGEAAGYAKPDFDDAAWKTTDTTMDCWTTLGHTYELTSAWYRSRTDLPTPAPGKRVHLWIAATDGTVRVFVNGKPVKGGKLVEQPDKTRKPETLDAPDGYAEPFTFDISDAVQPGANQITIVGTRTSLGNELGTGGLLGPVTIYQEK